MEGWLYLIRPNRFGLHYSRKRYFILKDNCLKSFKSKPVSPIEEPIRSAIIDSFIRVNDNGRESINRKVFFIFTVYNASDQKDQLKLGASSSEEAAKWIRSLQEAALMEWPNNPPKNFMEVGRSSLRLGGSKRRKNSVDWSIQSLMYTEAMTSDVISASPWKIFGCQNGLRLFKEANELDSGGRHWGDHPAIMAVGVVDGTSEAVFHTLMSLGSPRSEWDFCIYRGNLVDHIDGHTDIIHYQLYNDWLPRGMQRRDLLLRRYWRREDDGTYVLLFHSVDHEKCPPQGGYVRAWVKSGGFVVTPVNKGQKSIVKHMLAIDWKFWKLYLRPSCSRAITIRMLERIAALRELFRSKAGNYSPKEKPMNVIKGGDSNNNNNNNNNKEVGEEIEKVEEEQENRKSVGCVSLKGLNDSDEFFDVSEPTDSDQTDYEQFDSEWSPDMSSHQNSTNMYQSKLSAAGLVKKLHDLAVQKKGYTEIPDAGKEECCFYGVTLQNDSSCTLPCTWALGDPSSFLIRGETYLQDQHKVKGTSTMMQLVGVDWLQSDNREDDLGSRPNSITQKYASNGGPEFFFIINIQMPGSPMYNIALYYMTKSPLEETPLLHSFVNGDDAYRNSRFKLIPHIPKGSWIVKQSVGKKACLVGQALEVRYIRGKNYLELDIDVGSSTVARGVANLVLGYLNNLVIEMAFLIQANTQEELPEVLLGTCRFNHLDASKAVKAMP